MCFLGRLCLRFDKVRIAFTIFILLGWLRHGFSERILFRFRWDQYHCMIHIYIRSGFSTSVFCEDYVEFSMGPSLHHAHKILWVLVRHGRFGKISLRFRCMRSSLHSHKLLWICVIMGSLGTFNLVEVSTDAGITHENTGWVTENQTS